jgi:hypothetical protein
MLLHTDRQWHIFNPLRRNGFYTKEEISIVSHPKDIAFFDGTYFCKHKYTNQATDPTDKIHNQKLDLPTSHGHSPNSGKFYGMFCT